MARLRRTLTSSAVVAAVLTTMISVPATALPRPGADLNEDSRPDILSRVGTSDTVRLYFGNGYRAFSGSVNQTAHASRADFAYPAPGFTSPRSPDVMVRSHADGALLIYRASK